MRHTGKIILALAFVSFLTITMSGFHLHADVGGHGEAVSHSHDLHQDLASDLDHEAEHVDVSVFEPARGSSKVEVIAPVSSVPELVAARRVRADRAEDPPTIVPKIYSRWRPPLRAPPIAF